MRARKLQYFSLSCSYVPNKTILRRSISRTRPKVSSHFTVAGNEAKQSRAGLEVQLEMRAISPGLEVAPHQYRHHSTNNNDHLPFKKEGSWRNWICIITITVTATALIVGGAVGGGLGASLASCRQNLGVVQSCDNNNSK